MGHLLATVNPEAAAAIGKENVTSALPPIGWEVRYFPRPMEGRGGRTEFSFKVTEHTADGRVGGVATFDAQDQRDVRPCWQRTDDNPHPAWDWIPIPAVLMPPAGAQAAAGEITPPTARSVAEKIASLTHEVHVLQSSLSKAFAEIQNLRQAGDRWVQDNPHAAVTKNDFSRVTKRVDAVEVDLANAIKVNMSWDELKKRVAVLEAEFGIAPPGVAEVKAKPKKGK